VAKFTAKVEGSDGESFDIPAETCPRCKGIGYLTSPLTYESRNAANEDFHIYRAESGDRCPLYVGRGGVGLVDEWHPPR